ncbi:unnamed protein product [Bathycoccus prasinos]
MRRRFSTTTSAAGGNKTTNEKKKTSLSSSLSFSQLLCSPEEALNEKNITTTTGKNNNGFKMIRTELDQVVRCAEKSTTDTNTNNNDERGGHQRLVARVVVLDDDDDEEEDEDEEEEDSDVEEEIEGTQVPLSAGGEKKRKKKKTDENNNGGMGDVDVIDDNEEKEKEENAQKLFSTTLTTATPATAKRNKDKFRLHQMCAEGDALGVNAWLLKSSSSSSSRRRHVKTIVDEKKKKGVKSAKKFFASGTPADAMGGQTWPPPPVKEIFDAKTGRKLTPEEGKSGDGDEGDGEDDDDAAEKNDEKECDVNVRDDNGNTPLAIASALSDEEVSVSITEALLRDERIDVFGFCDVDGYAAVHWACKIGNAKTLEMLLAHDQSLVDFRADDLKCSTPAMVASRYAQIECLSVLKAFRCDINLRDIYGTSIVYECASELGTLKERTKWHSKTRKFLLDTFPELRVAILHHADCGDHVSVRPHQESPDRIVAILKALEIASDDKSSLKASGGGFFKDEFHLDDAFEEADPEDVLRAHTEDYVATLAELGEAVGDTPIAFTPFVQTKRGVPPRKIKPIANSDTFWSSGTLRAASRAAGAAVEGVKRVVEGKSRHVFCCVRPPGHHAGLEGATENAVSSGFSLVNNAMIGALHALETMDDIEKVCVIDFDVHHGNGTEEIARSWTNRQKREQMMRSSSLSASAAKKQIFFCSIHLADDGVRSGIEFYPNTGVKDDPLGNCLNVAIAPLWANGIEEKRIKTRKRHFDEQTALCEENNEATMNATQDTTTTTANVTTAVTTTTTENSSVANETGREAWMKAVKERLVPAIRAFAPNLLIMSAGFDAAETDLGNVGVDRRGERKVGVNLQPKDYEEMTARLVEAVESCPEAKGVVSILEGGYGSYDASSGLDRDILAKCCVSHVKGLSSFGFDKSTYP